MRNNISSAPIVVATKTSGARSFCLMIAMSPVMKAEIPETFPASIVIARAGLLAISSKILLPAGTDSYNKLVNDMPMKNNTGIATISPSDHLPDWVFGMISPRLLDLTLLDFRHSWQ